MSSRLVAYVVVHEKRIDIRWRDIDAYEHVNQAVYLTYLEEVVDDWLRALFGELWPYVAARVAIDYRAELRLDDRQAVGTIGWAASGRRASPRAPSFARRRGGWLPRPSS